MSIEIKSDILAKELNQGIVPLGVPKAYQYDAALVEAARAAVNQGLDDVADAGDTAKAAVEAQGTASVNAVSAQEQASKADVNALGDKILAQMKHGYGYPFTAATAAAMTDTAKIYVYTGSETGYTNGNWYYWNGTAWTSGGVYNATALETDKTLTVSGAAADAKIVGDKIEQVDLEVGVDNYYLVPIDDWAGITNKSDTGNWVSSKVYKGTYIESVDLKILSKTNVSGEISFYKYYEDGMVELYTSVSFSSFGVAHINIDKYIPFDFVVGIKCEKCAFESIPDSPYVTTPSSSNSFNVLLGTFKYFHCYNLNITPLKTTINTMDIYNVPILNIIPNSHYKYPIVFDFINHKITLHNFRLLCRIGDKNMPSYFIVNTVVDLPESMEDAYYYLFYDVVKNVFSVEKFQDALENKRTSNLLLVAACMYLHNLHAAYPMQPNSQWVLCKIATGDINSFDDSVYNNNIPFKATTKSMSDSIIKNPWFNTHISLIGDSICKGENPENGYKRMIDDNLATLIAKYFGLAHCYNYGIGGCKVSGNEATSLINRYNEIDIKSDLVIVFAGTNDFSANVELGSFDDLSDNTKFIPAYYNLLTGLIHRFYIKKIVCITPLHRASISQYNGPYLDENTPNSIGATLNDYIEAIKSVCAKVGVPFVDMFIEENGTPQVSAWANAYMPDGLHPNSDGMKKYVALTIINAIKNIYPSLYWSLI